ncbi:hypothetical protein UFOVP688_55 [uncultured Caudovirales phage]|uniref:Uncharacterized protein n=1 Tax=uncultured Caudovirales phage TaxID=2100421 RepID=A0A6J5NKA8_9CAUD|nr:hypothetical protein UFOVP688_55 [uncultured Caudovirales phage]
MPIVGSFAGASARAYGLGAGVAIGDFESIATSTAGSAVPSISFTSIPQTYTHLQIRGIARSSNATNGDFIYVQFNTDTANNYTYHLLNSDGSSAISASGTSQAGAGAPRISAASDTANVFGAVVIDILDYANTNKNTTIRTIGGYDANGSGSSRLTSGVWLNTAAVTSIAIKSGNAGNLAQYSSFSLYGVKA